MGCTKTVRDALVATGTELSLLELGAQMLFSLEVV